MSQSGIEKALEAGKAKREANAREAEAHKIALTAELKSANPNSSDDDITALVKKQLELEKLIKDQASARIVYEEKTIKLAKAKAIQLAKAKATSSKGSSSKTAKKVGEFDNMTANEKATVRAIRKAQKSLNPN